MSEFNSVQAIADRQAITDVIYRYLRTMKAAWGYG